MMQTGIDRSLAGVAVAVLALTAIIGGLALTAPTAETDVVARPSARLRTRWPASRRSTTPG